MRDLFTLFFVFFFFSYSYSQTKINGTVLSTNDIPLVGATVYYNNTSIGTTTDDEGKFELPYNESYKEIIVSYVGFKTASLLLTEADLYKKITFKLSSESNMLDEVVLNNSQKYSKEDRAFFLSQFRKSFIGKGEFSEYCRIKNPDVLSFDFDKKTYRIEAYASKPLIIINKKLGYRIYYDLVHFELENNKVYYLGYSRFQEIKASKKKTKRYEESRKIAYNGSKVHFLRSIYNGNVYEEGFEIDLMKRIKNPDRPSDQEILEARNYIRKSGKPLSLSIRNINPGKPITKLDSVYDILSRSRLKKLKEITIKPLALVTDFTGKVNTTYHFNFNDYLKIRYKKEEEEDEFRPGPAKLSHQESVISLTKKPLIIFKEGETESPIDLFAEGYWAFEKVAYQLPLNYKPL